MSFKALHKNMKMISMRNVIKKDNTISVVLAITINFETKTTLCTPEFGINGVVSQVKAISHLTDPVSGYADYYVFIRFFKECPDDKCTHKIKFTSKKLNITDQSFTSDEDTWRLIYQYEDYEPEFSGSLIVDVHMEVNVMPCTSSNDTSCTNPFASLHEDTELTDFELCGEDGSVHMHRAVLAAASPVLRRMLSGTWREAAEGRVDVSGTSKATLQHLKDYIYLNKLPASGLEQLLLLSKYYVMPELEQCCVDALVQCVGTENTCDMIEFAAMHKLTRLLLAILKCVQNGVVNVNEMYDQLVLCESMANSDAKQ